MKKLLNVLIIAVVAVAVLAVAKDAIIKLSVEKGVEVVSGLKMAIRSLNVGVMRPVVDIKGLRLLNPAAFSDRNMIEMPAIYVNYDLPAIIGGKIHLPEVRLALKEFTVVKNINGDLNLNAIRTVQAQKEGKSPAQKAPGKAPQIKIDLLKLSIGKVVYKDYSKGGSPEIREFNININESYANIEDPYTLMSLIVVKALMNTSIASLANFDLSGLQGTVGDTLAGAQKMASTAIDTAQKTVAQTQAAARQITETAQGAQQAAEEAAGAVKDIFKNPFGSGK